MARVNSGGVTNACCKAYQLEPEAASTVALERRTGFAERRRQSGCHVQKVHILASHPADVVDRNGRCVRGFRNNSRQVDHSKKPGGQVECRCSKSGKGLPMRWHSSVHEPAGLPLVRVVSPRSPNMTAWLGLEPKASLGRYPPWRPTPVLQGRANEGRPSECCPVRKQVGHAAAALHG